ncbi:hypothetical protein BDZ91DRAFT_754594 [Kalaharituber pfeilii]|nr:hypothetical protein BDZ91DRAFT_754594 [Kalaharituber pfeilii]
MRSKEIFEEETRMQAPKIDTGPRKNKEHWAKYYKKFIKEFLEKFQYVKVVGDLMRGEIVVTLARVKSTQKTLEKRVIFAKVNRSQRVARAGPYTNYRNVRLFVTHYLYFDRRLVKI